MEAEHGNDVSVAMQPYEMVRKARREAKECVEDQESATETEATKQKFAEGLESLTSRLLPSVVVIAKTSAFRKRKRRKKGTRKNDREKQDAAMKKLEAEALLSFANNNVEQGERICHEVIRMAPNSADVYQTLGAMIEQTGQQRKCQNPTC